ncbi:ribosomal maturation YjgA family protein [Streptomyces erythrochromogenes]
MTLAPGSGDSADAADSPDLVRIRLVAAGAAVVTVGAGLGLRAAAAGSVAKYGGDALYTVLLLTLVVLVAPRWTPLRAAGTALAVSWAVELFQLSSVPAELSRESVAARLVLGSTFNAPDLFWYAAGAAGGWLLHRAMDRRRRVTAGALPAGETPHT